MKIELKNLKINQAFSEETTCFTADVFINGKKVGYARNDGRGGCKIVQAYPNQHDLLIEAEKFCSELPKRIFEYGGNKHEFSQSLEHIVDDLVFEKGKEKEQKKIQKLCENHIVFGKPNGFSYKVISFNGKPKFTDLMKTIQGQKSLENLVERVKVELKEGEEIFNKNLDL